MSGWHHIKDGNVVFQLKSCEECGKDFQPKSGVHKFCSETCKRSYGYRHRVTTEQQYENISGNWYKYCLRLITNTRRSLNYAGLSIDDLLEILEEQDYKCAITGVPLTCTLEKNKKFRTNVSTDRIVAGGPYNKDNIRLTCSIVNKMRLDLSDEEFLYWCRMVVGAGEANE